ncbi:MAG: hypothetical protein NZM38_04135 [Cytophagales bacterium]|nr:hypothetical protein [Cytophagales bacterium]MDW8383940.1 hypothetical protein [Flammeovirgaceae bacterium]
MRRVDLFLALGFLLLWKISLACEICGCGVGNIYTGIMPQFSKNFVGIRYRSMTFRSHLKRSPIFHTEEHFYTAEIWARYYPLSKLQLIAFFPYHYNIQIQKSQGKKIVLNGIGDPAILGSYALINTSNSMKRVKQNFLVGAGIKFPFGKYQYDAQNTKEVANPNFQLGSGSVDFLFNAFYTLRFNKWGITTDLSYKLNTQNKQQYRFGNRTAHNIAIFFIAKFRELGLMPYLGSYYEFSEKDTQSQYPIEITGGRLWNGSWGCEFYFRKIIVGSNVQIPFVQNLANQNIRSENRWNLHFSFVF